jgi:alpha-mannosidase
MPYYHYEEGHQVYLKSVVEKLLQVIYKPIANLQAACWVTAEPVPFEKRRTGKKKLVKPGQKWGGTWDCGWFNFKGRIPSSAPKKNLALLIDVKGEACLFDDKGTPVRGLTAYHDHGNVDCLGVHGKRVVHLDRARPGETINIWVEAGVNDLWGAAKGYGVLKEAQIALCNEQLRGLFYDYAVLLELLEVVPEDKTRHHSILHSLTNAAHQLFEYTEEEARRARKCLAGELAKKSGTASLTISALGHAHIDLAWLWPIRETIRKGTRTFATALYLMERYPDYIFGASQAQLYQWIKDHHPAMYQKIKKRIAQGRWDVQGALWVETDTNVAGGEALVRQILYGKRYFREEFNLDIKTCWLPDCFGFTGALPQLLKKSGVDYFLTTKLSWNKYNKFPHHTFVWQGIDGSEVLTHMPPFSHYNATAAPRDIHTHEKTYADKLISDQAMMLFGIGDGGGGPGAEHLESLMRVKNLDGIAPVVQQGSEKFFRQLECRRDQYHTWCGELYLEIHQGTLTSQARNKRFNRKLEIALRETELSSVLALLGGKYEYPTGPLDALWREMLLYQFHDILPGSSITRVYDESLQRYRDMLKQTARLNAQADSHWTKAVDISSAQRPAVVVNSLSWPRCEWINIQDKWHKVEVDAMGYAVVDRAEKQVVPVKLTATTENLENELLRIRFAKDGSIKSIHDKQNRREVLAAGESGNKLTVYEDLMAHFSDEAWGADSAWDFPAHYEEKKIGCFKLDSVEVFLDGPRAVLQQRRSFGDSLLIQRIILTAGSRRIDFVTEVDWKEARRMLRCSFPVAVRADEATCDIQFGTIKRPTHRNTSWDMAKFEICAHKWVDISQPDYGVALLNDCKYGYKVHGNVLDLNLLRSPGFPDPQADRARHEFTYSLYPHVGDHLQGKVARQGYELNMPLRVIPMKKNTGGKLPAKHSFLQIDAENVIIETVKKAEDSNDIIIRLYENSGASVKTKLQLGFSARSARRVNLMESDAQPIKMTANQLELSFKPFEILTLKISPRN